MEKLIITRREAAEALSISVDTLDGLRANGHIKGFRIGARVYYTREEMDAFVKKAVKKGAIYA